MIQKAKLLGHFVKLNYLVTMGDKLLNGIYKAKILTGESTDSYNDIEHPNRVAPKEVELKFKNGVVHLPPHSLTIVYIKGEV